MNIYLLMMGNGYGNTNVHSVWATKADAEAKAKELEHNQERCDNIYWVDTRGLQGDEFALFPKSSLIRRYEEKGAEIERLKLQLKRVAENIESLDIEQPHNCLFGYGSCGYPIDDCYNCPMHSWSDHTPFLTSCEFK